MKIKSLLVAGILVLAASISTATASSIENLVGYSNNIVKVFSDPRMGSGTFISPNLVLTNNHVISPTEENEPVTQVIVHTPDGTERVGIVIKQDAVNDLALIQMINYKHSSYAPLATKAPAKLSPVWSMGFPAGLKLTITAGTYQYTYVNPMDHYCEVTTAPIFYGNSGGSTAVMENGELRLLGVTTSVVVAGGSVYAHGACSVSYKVIREFLN